MSLVPMVVEQSNRQRCNRKSGCGTAAVSGGGGPR